MATEIDERPDRPMTAAPGLAGDLAPMLEALLGSPLRLRVELWDGSAVGPAAGPGRLIVRSADALRRILWAPGELGLSRAWVEGDIDADGDLIEVLRALSTRSSDGRPWHRALPAAARVLRHAGGLGRPLPPPAAEYRPTRWRQHTRRRDAAAISHHYDASNDFYAIVLGPSMTYSCARFAEPTMTLAEAQASKHDHICRKLGLDVTPGARLLDVGCGWGSMAIHAAAQHGAQVVGITLSREQAQLARKRVADAGLIDRVEIRHQDYRDLDGETFDAVSSIGMFEHVGTARVKEYFTVLRRVLRPQGRLLNHAISSVGGSRLRTGSFLYRYVFPDGELIDVGDTVLAMEAAGFEVRDVESLREHYATTLRHWIANLEAGWDAAVAEVGEARARVWRLYMAGSVVGFEDGGNNLHQVLGVVPAADGSSGFPPVRPA